MIENNFFKGEKNSDDIYGNLKCTVKSKMLIFQIILEWVDGENEYERKWRKDWF